MAKEGFIRQPEEDEIVAALRKEATSVGLGPREALETLSRLAFAGHKNVQEAVDAIDEMVESGKLVLSKCGESSDEQRTGCSRLPVVGIIFDILKGGEVPRDAWSEADRKQLEAGERSRGYPEHPNI